MNWHGYSLQKGVIVSSVIELIMSLVVMIVAAVKADDFRFCKYYPSYYWCNRYKVSIALAVVSGYIIVTDIIMIFGAIKKHLNVIRMSIPLSVISSISNVVVLSLFYTYFEYGYQIASMVYLVIYCIYKSYALLMLRRFCLVLAVENGAVPVIIFPAAAQPTVSVGVQQTYPNGQYPQGQQQYPNVPPPYTQNSPYPNVQQPYPNAQQPYPNAQQPYPNAQQPYPNAQQPYPNVQQPYPNVQQPYPNVQQPFPNAQRDLPNDQPSSSNATESSVSNDPLTFPHAQTYPTKY